MTERRPRFFVETVQRKADACVPSTMPLEARLTLVPPQRSPDARDEQTSLAAMGDDDLMTLSAAGSRGAFRELVRRYQGRVLGVCVRSAASAEEGREIAQEAFVALWQVAPRYRPSGSFPAFLFTIVRNQLRSSARRRAAAVAGTRELSRAEPEGGGAVALEQLLAAENQRRLQEALAELDEVHRRAILLRFSAELPYDEIAGICNAPVGTVRSWVHHGLRKLRALLGDPS
jgi:RNA polymerase sigma-70 factor (ECF subfamily)